MLTVTVEMVALDGVTAARTSGVVAEELIEEEEGRKLEPARTAKGERFRSAVGHSRSLGLSGEGVTAARGSATVGHGQTGVVYGAARLAMISSFFAFDIGGFWRAP